MKLIKIDFIVNKIPLYTNNHYNITTHQACVLNNIFIVNKKFKFSHQRLTKLLLNAMQGYSVVNMWAPPPPPPSYRLFSQIITQLPIS